MIKEVTWGTITVIIFNGLLLIFISILIMWESFQRFTEPQAISSTGMLLISSIGAYVNIIVAWIMHQALARVEEEI